MYILYKQDGSVVKKNLTDYIQKGNNNVNSIFIAIENLDPSEWNATAVFELPNGDLSSETPTYDDDFEIDGETCEGWVVPITAAETIYEGILKLSLTVYDNEDDPTTLFTTTVKLVINPSVIVPNETTITYAQYQSIMSLINQKAPIDAIVHLYRHRITIHKNDDPSFYETLILLSSKSTAYTLLKQIFDEWNSIVIISEQSDLTIANGTSIFTDKISQYTWSKRVGNTIRRTYKEYNLTNRTGTSTSVDLEDSNAVIYSDTVQEIS